MKEVKPVKALLSFLIVSFKIFLSSLGLIFGIPLAKAAAIKKKIKILNPRKMQTRTSFVSLKERYIAANNGIRLIRALSLKIFSI
jgi:hypothetical protein